MPATPHIPQVMLLIETSRGYGRGLARGIGRYVSEHGPWSIHFEERGLHDRLPSWVRSWRGDGVIARTPRQSDINKLLATGLPLVELFADPDLGLPCVYPKLDRIGDLAAEHLAGLGLENIAFFATDRAWWIEDRRNNFVRAIEQRGYSCSCYVRRPRRGAKSGHDTQHQNIIDWIESLPKPCGVFCASDLYAMQLLDICRSCGVAVPEEIAVLGVDNDPVLCGVSFPPLSSIEINSERVGYEAAALLDRMMAGEQPEEKAVWVEPGQIVARQSTDILAIDDPEVAQAVRFIREHACRGISVQDVADAMAISRRGLERRFPKFLSRTPKEEIMRVQIDRARMLLRETDMTIELVTKRSGFASLKHFARVFRRATGVTPRAFRQACRVPGVDVVPDKLASF